jgi:hypothetical protein
MKFYSVYGNCQGMIFAAFLNNNPGFNKQYQYIPLNACNLIKDTEVDDFIDNTVKKLDLFIYIPISDDYRNDYKFSSNFFLSQLRPDCIKISFPSLYFYVYDRQMTYLTDEQGNRVNVPHEYHDKILIKMFMTYRHLKNEEIYQKYIEFIHNSENFSKTELQEAAISNYKELKRRENLLVNDERNNFVLRIADFINENYQNTRLFYSLNHPSRYIYLHLREQLFRYLQIETNEADANPNLDPHTDFVFGIFPPIRKYLGLRFEDHYPFPSNTVGYEKYLDFYRSFSIESLTKIGIYPVCGTFICKEGWSEDEITHRWAISQSAIISIYNDKNDGINSKLLFTLVVVRSQSIKVFLNGVCLKEVNLTSANSALICLNITLAPGENILKFFSDSPPVSPGGGDLRKLSFAISQFSVIRDSEISAQ